MSLAQRSLPHIIERVLPPTMLAALLAFQFTHLFLEGARAQVPLYSGTYTVLEEERPFLPALDEMKRLGIQVGAQQGVRLKDQNVDVALVLDMLRVTIRSDDQHDWKQFFSRYRDELRHSAMLRCEQTQIGRAGLCASLLQLSLRGWSAGRSSWIKPLDLASVMILATALGMWLAGHRPAGTP